MDTYGMLADLPLTIDDYHLTKHAGETSSDFTRTTTSITLRGDESRGHGEDVTYETEDHDALLAWDGRFPLAGTYSFHEYAQLLDDIDLFPTKAPDRDIYRNYRRWGFESAGLDLALRQNDIAFADAVNEQYSPVSFVVSTRLGDPPSFTRIREWREINPDLTFKLDPTSDWPSDLIDALAATDAIRILDLKGQYEGTDVDQPPDPDLYRQLVTAFPDALIEDPGLTDRTNEILADHTSRVSWDVPITDLESLADLPFPPRWINIKPSRFGSLESLLETITYCREHDINMYGGGQFELGIGRSQLHALASVFYPEAPNDVAPAGFNRPTPQSGLPGSPLAVPENPHGFVWNSPSNPDSA